MFVAFYHNWIILAFLGPLFWTVSDFIDKFVLEKHTVGIWDFLFFFSLFSWVCLGLLVWVYGVPPLSEQSIFAVLLGFATTASFYLYARGLMVLDTSQAILTFKLVPITVTLHFLAIRSWDTRSWQPLLFWQGPRFYSYLLMPASLGFRPAFYGCLRPLDRGRRYSYSRIKSWIRCLLNTIWSLTHLARRFLR